MPVPFFTFKTHPMEDHNIKFHRTGHGLSYELLVGTEGGISMIPRSTKRFG